MTIGEINDRGKENTKGSKENVNTNTREVLMGEQRRINKTVTG
jgi:hypothetical protein